MATVEEIQAEQKQRTETVFGQAGEFLRTLGDLADVNAYETNALPNLEYSGDATSDVVDFLMRFVPPSPGVAFPITVPLPVAPVTEFTELAPVTVPDFSSASPTISIPSAPSAALPSVPAAPTVTDPDIPAAPTLTFPAVPSFTPLEVPLPPAIDLPSFTAGLPAEDFLTPSNTFEWYEQAYSSELLDSAKAKLLNDMLNGGYGIETADEAQLWERARAREEEQADQARRELVRQTARRGFPIPPGSMQVSIDRLNQEFQNKVSTLSRDIALRRSELYVENRKFTIQEVRSLETVLIGFHNSIQERALNAVKATLDAAIAIYEAQLKRYNARLDAYKTESAVFESKIRAALAQVEIYRTTMEGKRLEVDTQRQAVELYRAQLAGIEQLVNVYRVRMDAANVRASVERTKIDAFRSLIDAYTAQVQAKGAEFQMFESRIRGEVAKVQAYEAEVRAYGQRVEGLKTQADIRLGKLRAEAEEARAKTEIYRGDIAAAELALRAQTEAIDAVLKRYGVDIQAYSAQVNALAEAYRLQGQRDRDQKDVMFKTAEVKLQNAQQLFERTKAVLETKLGAQNIASRYFSAVLGGLVQAVQGITTKAISS